MIYIYSGYHNTSDIMHEIDRVSFIVTFSAISRLFVISLWKVIEKTDVAGA